MKILITGGAGFIGSNFILYMLKKNPALKIVNLDKLTYAGNLGNLKGIERNKNYSFVRGDIANERLVDKLLSQCDAVVHFAAESHVDRSIIDAQNFITTNVFGTYVLLKLALKNKIQRFVHISTDEVYGSRKKGFFDEQSPLNPSSPYSASKASSDLLARSFFITHQLPVLITRSSNNFGPRQYPEKVIPLFITHLLKNEKVPLYAKGLNVRDWIYVEDNCRAIELVLKKGKIGEVYNIAAESYLNNITLTKLILKKMGKPLSMIEHVKDRPGHDFRYAIETSKIKALGFKPRMHFHDALALTINWYKHHQSW